MLFDYLPPCDPASFLVSTGMLALVVMVARLLMLMLVLVLEAFESWTAYHVFAACSEKEAQTLRVGHEWEEEVHERIKKGGKGVSAGAWRVDKNFASFTHCSRRGFPHVYGVLVDEGHGVMFLLALRRLRHYSFYYLRRKNFPWCFYAFCRGLFHRSAFYANPLKFQLF